MSQNINNNNNNNRIYCYDEKYIDQICNEYPYIVSYENDGWLNTKLWIPKNKKDTRLLCKSINDIFECVKQAVINLYDLDIDNEQIKNKLIELKLKMFSELDNELQSKIEINKKYHSWSIQVCKTVSPSFFGIQQNYLSLYPDEDHKPDVIHFYISFTNRFSQYFDLEYSKIGGSNNGYVYRLCPFSFDSEFRYSNMKHCIPIFMYFIERINNGILIFRSNHYIPSSLANSINMNLYISSIEETNNNKYLLKNISKKNILNKLQLMINDNNIINNHDYAGFKLDINDFYSVNKNDFNLIWSSIYIINNNYITNNELYIKNSMTNDTQININNSLNRFRDDMIRDIRKKCLLKSKNVFIYFLNNKYNKSITNKIIDYVI